MSQPDPDLPEYHIPCECPKPEPPEKPPLYYTLAKKAIENQDTILTVCEGTAIVWEAWEILGLFDDD